VRFDAFWSEHSSKGIDLTTAQKLDASSYRQGSAVHRYREGHSAREATMRYCRSRPSLTIEEAAQCAIALAQGIGELVELEHNGRRVIVSPTHLGQVCHEWMNTEVQRATQ
jgi:hypothetical protein